MKASLFFILFLACVTVRAQFIEFDERFPIPAEETLDLNPQSPLKAYKIDPSSITVSGVSSGAYMAIQLQVAYSSVFSGAASVAGGTYWCAQGSPQKAQTDCMSSPQNINSQEQIARAQTLAQQNQIDPLTNLASKRFYLYASPRDQRVNAQNTTKLTEFLTAFTAAGNIRTVNSPAAAHGFLTVNQGGACDIEMPPYILACNYDMAGDILQTLYGKLALRAKPKPPKPAPKPQTPAPKPPAPVVKLFKFSQDEFSDQIGRAHV